MLAADSASEKRLKRDSSYVARCTNRVIKIDISIEMKNKKTKKNCERIFQRLAILLFFRIAIFYRCISSISVSLLIIIPEIVTRFICRIVTASYQD